MVKIVYSLAFALDKECLIREDLITSNSLYKLDEHIKKNFQSTLDVRNKYDDLISNLCLCYRERIQKENERNHNNRTGHVVIIEKVYDDNNKLISVIPIKVIYKNHHILKRYLCIRKIKEALNDDSNLERLYKEKKYLLSQNEKDLLRLYFDFKNVKYKNSAIGFFTRRIKDESSSSAYYYCRHLASLCSLVDEDVITNLKNINSEKDLKNMTVKKESPYVEVESEQMTMDNLLKKGGI